MNWYVILALIIGEALGMGVMAILSGRLDRRMELREKKKSRRCARSAAAHEAQKGFNYEIL